MCVTGRTWGTADVVPLNEFASPKADLTRSQLACCLTSTETTRLIRDGEKGCMEVGEEGDRYTVTARTIPALRWAAMRAILMFQ